MTLVKSAVAAFAALALAAGAAWAADKADKPMDSKNSDGKLSKKEAANVSRSDASGFAKLDKNKDGYISKAEAKGETELTSNFDKWDMNNDGKINRAEYLAAMAKADVSTTGKKIGNAVSKDKPAPDSGASSGASTKKAPN